MYGCFYVITSVSWQCWSNYSHTNKLNQQILLSDAKLTQYLLFTQNYEANLLAIDSHMVGFFLIHFQAFIIFIHSNMKLASKIWWKQSWLVLAYSPYLSISSNYSLIVKMVHYPSKRCMSPISLVFLIDIILPYISLCLSTS